MANSLDVNIVSIPLYAADWGGDDIVMHVLKAPEAGQGGGITILRATVTNQAATNGSTAWALELRNYGTGGTAAKASNSVVAAARGDTADVFVAGVPKTFTLSNPYLAPGEYLVAKKTETNSSDPVRGMLIIEYAMGA